MISKMKLLSYIDKHPHCSYETIAKKYFDNDLELTSLELLRYDNLIICDQSIAGWSQGKQYVAIKNISLNTLGKQELSQWINDKWRFRIPLIFSIIAIVIAGLSAYFTYLQI